MAAYRFDPKEEPATMLIQVNPYRYVSIASSIEKDKRGNFIDDGKMYHPVKKVKMGSDGKNRIVWDYETEGEVWVPPRIGNNLIVSADGAEPVAKMVATRTEEQANDGIDPRTIAKKKSRRKVTEE